MRRRQNWFNHFVNLMAVVLGVYLAFYINERAQENAEQREVVLLMHSLLNDLSGDERIYEEFEIPSNVEQQEMLNTLLEALINEDMDLLPELLSAALVVENFAPTTTTYTSMKSAGKLGLIHDLELQKKLSEYYEGLAIESIKKGDFQVEFFTGEILPWMTDNVDLMSMQVLNFDALIVLRNKLIIYQSLIDQKVSNYKDLAENSKLLKEHITGFIDQTEH